MSTDQINNKKEMIEITEEKKIDLILTNWSTFKDRIKFFDEIISRLRLEGTPICIAIFTLGFITKFWLIYLLGIIYILGILTLDLLHFRLLIESVKGAKEIESRIENNLLYVTQKLTKRSRTVIHIIGVIILYGILIFVGILLIVFNPLLIELPF